MKSVALWRCKAEILRFPNNPRGSKDNQGGAENAQNIPAQEETETEGARLQKENGNCRRQKCTQEKTRERQKTPYLLIE